jgi:hypothetical protein
MHIKNITSHHSTSHHITSHHKFRAPLTTATLSVARLAATLMGDLEVRCYACRVPGSLPTFNPRTARMEIAFSSISKSAHLVRARALAEKEEARLESARLEIARLELVEQLIMKLQWLWALVLKGATAFVIQEAGLSVLQWAGVLEEQALQWAKESVLNLCFMMAVDFALQTVVKSVGPVAAISAMALVFVLSCSAMVFDLVLQCAGGLKPVHLIFTMTLALVYALEIAQHWRFLSPTATATVEELVPSSSKTPDVPNPPSTTICFWTGKLNELEPHASTCPHISVCCTYDGCEELVQRGALATHIAACRHRSVVCAECGEDVKLSEGGMAAHKTSLCSRRPSTCPNAGCGVTHPHEVLMAHRDFLCLHEVVACPHAVTRPGSEHHGCGVRVRRNELSYHIVDCVHRLEACELDCGADVKVQNMDEHMTTRCPNRLLPCPNAGCGTTLPYRELKTHREVECLYEVIACPHESLIGGLYRLGLHSGSLAHYGCTERVKRGDCAAHVLSCLHRVEECVFGCGENVKMRDVDSHQTSECTHRPLQCPNSGCSVTCAHHELQAHRDVCLSEEVTCPHAASTKGGTSNIPFTPVRIEEWNAQNTHKVPCFVQNITAMPEYANKSVEELRLEDYERDDKTCFGITATSEESADIAESDGGGQKGGNDERPSGGDALQCDESLQGKLRDKRRSHEDDEGGNVDRRSGDALQHDELQETQRDEKRSHEDAEGENYDQFPGIMLQRDELRETQRDEKRSYEDAEGVKEGENDVLCPDEALQRVEHRETHRDEKCPHNETAGTRWSASTGGTGSPPFRPVEIIEKIPCSNGTSNNQIAFMHTITAMPEYSNKSVEELRLEDSERGDKNTRGRIAVAPRSGCTERVKRGECAAHAAICVHRLEACELGCGANVKVRDMDAHKTTRCPNRFVPCPNAGCGVMLRIRELRAHREVECLYEDLPCPVSGFMSFPL